MNKIKAELHQWIDSLSDYEAVEVQQLITPYIPDFPSGVRDEVSSPIFPLMNTKDL